MYAGYKINGFNLSNSDYYFKLGNSFFSEQKDQIENRLAKYVIPNIGDVIDGMQIESDWFPTVNSHIFISHSHADQPLAITLAGYLKTKYNLDCFVDSCVWGYADKLLKQIDDRYCIKSLNPKIYSYEQRNYSTSHVHAMLTMALTQMLRKSECLVFLNTPKSIPLKGISEMTLSPWIYEEICLFNIIEKKNPIRNDMIQKAYSGGSLNESLKMSHSLDTSKLISLSLNELIKLLGELQGINALDYLYINTLPRL